VTHSQSTGAHLYCLERIRHDTSITSGEISDDHHVLDVPGWDAESLGKLPLTSEDMGVLIRRRLDSDLSACADLVREVHAVDRYPRFLADDLISFLAQPGSHGSWVADGNGEILGHVALSPRTAQSVMEIASQALGRPASQLAAVSRLFVSPRARGSGIGRLLLDAAAADATSRGLWPVLDVDTDLAAAIALYESRGWRRAGKVTLQSSSGQVLSEYVYLGPGQEPPG
jgi:GNAT superfamily N-acetyltransferase